MLAGSYVRAYAVAGELMLLVKSGLRFSRKAVSASFASSERTCALNSSFSAFIAALICFHYRCPGPLVNSLQVKPQGGFRRPRQSVKLSRVFLLSLDRDCAANTCLYIEWDDRRWNGCASHRWRKARLTTDDPDAW
jgi:hypothetical protein